MPPFLQVSNGHGASAHFKWELQGFTERTDPQALRRESPTAVLVREGLLTEPETG